MKDQIQTVIATLKGILAGGVPLSERAVALVGAADALTEIAKGLPEAEANENELPDFVQTNVVLDRDGRDTKFVQPPIRASSWESADRLRVEADFGVEMEPWDAFEDEEGNLHEAYYDDDVDFGDAESIGEGIGQALVWAVDAALKPLGIRAYPVKRDLDFQTASEGEYQGTSTVEFNLTTRKL